MKTIGLIGGMSWESTVTYYEIINKVVKEKMGGLHSAKILMYSVDFHEIEECQSKGLWNKSASILSEAAKNLEKAGADFIIICTNTMHKVAGEIQSQIKIPIIHIADSTIKKLKEKNISKVALLGTKYTMKQDFYKKKIIESGIEVLIPNDSDIERVNSIIYDELCLGIIKEESKKEYIEIIQRLKELGAEGVILGCTEIGLLIKDGDIDISVFDTTRIHAEEAAMLGISDIILDDYIGKLFITLSKLLVEIHEKGLCCSEAVPIGNPVVDDFLNLALTMVKDGEDPKVVDAELSFVIDKYIVCKDVDKVTLHCMEIIKVSIEPVASINYIFLLSYARYLCPSVKNEMENDIIYKSIDPFKNPYKLSN